MWFAALLPLMGIHMGMPTSSVVTVSDASEECGGVCPAETLTEVGTAWLFQRLAPAKGLLDGTVILVESFAGVSSARAA